MSVYEPGGGLTSHQSASTYLSDVPASRAESAVSKLPSLWCLVQWPRDTRTVPPPSGRPHILFPSTCPFSPSGHFLFLQNK